jgi:hypothetical protein
MTHFDISRLAIAALRKEYHLWQMILIRSLITHPKSGASEHSAASPTPWSAFPLRWHLPCDTVQHYGAASAAIREISDIGTGLGLHHVARTNAVSISV